MPPPAPYIPGAYPTTSAGRSSTAAAAATGAAIPPASSWGARAGMQSRAGGGAGPGYSRAGPMTAGGSGGADPKRPVTSSRAAGYSSRGRPTTANMAAFDPFRGSKAGSPPGGLGSSATNGGNSDPTKSEPSPEDQVRDMERHIYALLHESAMTCTASPSGRYTTAAGTDPTTASGLAKAKEAVKRERALVRHREHLGLMDTVNLDLTYCVLVNLAHHYALAGMPAEAISTYTAVVKNKTFHQSGRLRVNMGNLYLGMGKVSQAIKMYRMALDQLQPNQHRDLRLKVLHNLSVAFFRAGQLGDAVTALETVMESKPDHRAGFHLVVCYYALGEKDKMRRAFQRLVAVPYPKIETDPEAAGTSTAGAGGASSPAAAAAMGFAFDDSSLLATDDPLRNLARTTIKQIERKVLLAGKLIARALDASASPDLITQTYDWLADTVRGSPAAAVAAELEMAKAVHYLRARDTPRAASCLQEFARRAAADAAGAGDAGQVAASMAYTNLAFLALLEGDTQVAAEYAEQAIAKDRYNARAHSNRGNAYFAAGEWASARDMYVEAVSLDAECTEAAFNLGLVYKQLGMWKEAGRAFDKLHSMLRGSPEVVWNLADIHERTGNLSGALEWYSVLISITPTDPSVLAKLGSLHARANDPAQALHHFSEAHRYDPGHTDALAWLAHHHVKCEAYESALPLFERLSVQEPREIQWPLMAASCLRRSGRYDKALEAYRAVHERWPQSVEALRFLVRLAADVNAKELPEWRDRLAKVEAKGTAAGGEEGAGSGMMMGGMVTTAVAGGDGGIKTNGSRDSVRGSGTSLQGGGASVLGQQSGLFGTEPPRRESGAVYKEDAGGDEYNVEDMLP
ncbi:hypothetical protein BCR44DRAFT_46917 [Catenaria anguillulae PL171]|uniref:Uncharacterized protein n=1 Tax=Catenaria anguillulae PL171 TaxID=765915 RepID=A0A1Y2H6F2_9FUNG|nr:hypothetical protein BCR44DRAFT_46917 [Catenaria anguillulae PL171]